MTEELLKKENVTKYGPVTVHQNGVAARHLAATPTPVVGTSSHIAHSLENVRFSLHLERFDAAEKLSVDLKCITRFPEYGYELKHNAPCEMRLGQMHGAAVVQATCICVDFENPHNTTMEIEYMLGEESLIKLTLPVRFPVVTEGEE